MFQTKMPKVQRSATNKEETHLKECKIGRDDTNLFAMKIKKGVEVNLGLGTHYELHMDDVLSFVDVTLEMLL
jgi:hypothetical protein